MKIILPAHLVAGNWNEVAAMNLLQEHGIISDLCVTAIDVAPEDAAAASEWLKRWRGEIL